MNPRDAYKTTSRVGGLASPKTLAFNNLQISNQPTPPILVGSADLHFINSLISNHLSIIESADSRTRRTSN